MVQYLDILQNDYHTRSSEVDSTQAENIFSCVIQLYVHTYVHILFHLFFHCGLLQDIESSSLCCTVGPCCLSLLCIVVCREHC